MLEFVDNWRLSKKMFVAFAFLALLVTGLALNGFLSTRRLDATAQVHVTRDIAGMSMLADVISDIKEQRIITYSYFNAANAEDAAKLEKRMNDSEKALARHIQAYGKVAGADFQGQVATLGNVSRRLAEVNGQIFDLKRQGDVAATLKLVKGDGKTLSHDAIEATEHLLAMTRDRSDKAAAKGAYEASRDISLAVILAIVAFAGLAAIWLMINRTVARPMALLSATTKTLAEGGNADVPFRGRGDELGEIARTVEQFRTAAVARAEVDANLAAEQQIVTTSLQASLEALTTGDLTADILADFPPAYAELKSNFNTALSSLRELIGSVMESTSTIRTGSGEIAQASEDLARRTENNASSLEETTAAITQMDGRLKATAAAASRTVERADGAITTVSGGRAVADEAVQAMGRVSESAKGIDSVIEGLDKIAFQTRVLAMNAAVEAGRAGDAGRGFAVVADLVSALAMRAEEESKRARDQLTVTQTDIVAAVGAVEKVDAALVNISGDVGEVHKLLGEMAADNQAQSVAVTQISSAIGTMDQATQQNAAMVEETSAAARNLTSEVAALADQAARFNVGATHSRAVTPTYRIPATRKAAPAIRAVPAAAMANGAGGSDEWATF